MGWGILFLSLLSATALGKAASNDPGPKFGPEFTFSNANASGYDGNTLVQQQIIDRMHQHLVESQPEGAKFNHKSTTQFKSPNGWEFTVSVDVEVVEVQMEPMTAADFEKYQADIQDAIFVSAHNEKAFPSLFLGGGHINVDLGYFAKKPPLLLRNFLVDRINHTELAMGIMNYDTNNAIPYGLMPAAIAEIQKTLKSFDAGEMGDIHIPSWSTVEKLIAGFASASIGHDRRIRGLWGSPGRGSKASEISFEDTRGTDYKNRRIEIRAVRPQQSAQMWVNQIKLIRDRIFFLKTIDKPIPLQPFMPVAQDGEIHHIKLDPPMTAHQALVQFYSYVRETGHRWEDHRDYIWPEWKNGKVGEAGPSELEKFENSSWFKGEQCRGLLEPTH